MRVNLFQEETLYPNGMYLEAGSIDLSYQDKFVLYKNPEYIEVLGLVTELRREEDGWISGEVSVDVDTEWYQFSMYCDKLQTSEKNPARVIYARLRAVSLQPIPIKPIPTENFED